MTTQMTCDPCAHADAHGWWGPDHAGTHCRDCHRSWTAPKQAHCARCHEQFNSERVFDTHLSHCGGALAALRRENGNPVFDVRDHGKGPVWVRWGADDRFQRA